MVAGHSYGELVALHAAGVLSAPALAELSLARGRFMREAGRAPTGAMAALLAGPDEVEQLDPRRSRRPGRQLERPQADGDRRADRGRQARARPGRDPWNPGPALAGLVGVPHPAGRPAREPAGSPGERLLDQAPDRPVYSNLDAAPTRADPAAIAARLGDHLASPVRFADMIEAMHRDGARVFVEVGPGSILTRLVESILTTGRIWPSRAIRRASAGLAGWLAPSPAWSWPDCRSGSSR